VSVVRSQSLSCASSQNHNRRSLAEMPADFVVSDFVLSGCCKPLASPAEETEDAEG